MADVTELVEWLRAQLDEDERVARWALIDGGEGWWNDPDPQSGPENHIARWDPDRVLAVIDAMRRLLDAWRSQIEEDDDAVYLAGPIIPRLLALPYADRPGYREEWAPEVFDTNPDGA